MKAVLVPAYNEEKNIGEVIQRLKKFKLKIVVIDDGSIDKTSKIARRKGAIVIRHEKNKGKAEAIKTGISFLLKKYAKVDKVVLIDADMQYLPEECEKFFKKLDEADYVIGARKPSEIPFFNRFGNFIWRNAFNLLFGTKFLDTNCGYIGMNRKAMEEMRKVIYGGYILENAMLMQAIKRGLKIAHVPVKVLYKGKRNWRKSARMFFGVLLFILWQGLKYRISKL